MRRAVLQKAQALYSNSKQQPCLSSSSQGNWFCGASAITPESLSVVRPSCSRPASYQTASRCFTTSAVASQPSGKVIKQQNRPQSKLPTLPADDLSTLLQGQNSSSKAAFIFALPCLFTAFLGTWQVQRRHWKVDLLQARTAALKVTAHLVDCLDTTTLFAESTKKCVHCVHVLC